ncbi:MAG TPA: cell division protein ZapB [Thermodesulfovibrio thiophilus]|uniref:cell division protein ZapB n=1 Tax=Thermodesulfovibrio thiophilus TaxID=340095 RepID=UPI0003F4DA35|nr:cell division protein ZapB [Thermodesulfovibrio thiophilus]HOA82483.1 cell division protein ZapB [Thermodesulfovibrio thiophilus]HQD35473.1 cell division protein ZapB [Thermodesulfovibrio thiophilus]
MIEEKIMSAVERIKMLKQEKEELQKKVNTLEEVVKTKNQEIENLLSERDAVKKQIEELLKELDMETNA